MFHPMCIIAFFNIIIMQTSKNIAYFIIEIIITSISITIWMNYK